MPLSAKTLEILKSQRNQFKNPGFVARPKVFSDDHVFNMGPSQSVAANRILKEDGVFFLTGQAGTGKSYVIHYLNSVLKRGAVNTATTGIAAQLIGGRTTYSYASIHPSLGAVSSFKADNRVRSTELLFIDEISMANDWFGYQLISRFAQADYQPNKIVFVGDFYQLPPVEGDFIFKSPLWGELDVKVLKLKEQFRQDDTGFTAGLNDLRVGKISGSVLKILKECKCESLPTDCVQLYALRAKVDYVNQQRLAALPGKPVTFEWSTQTMTKDNVDFEQFRFSPTLRLKENARIVMINNDESQRWVNGSTGTIVELPSDDDKSGESFITVRLDKNDVVVQVAKATEELHGADGFVSATCRQYPLMLAWALTVHKAQGMSMDRVGVDLTKHFASGMTYVGLSRARSIQGLFLIGNFNRVPVNKDAHIFE